MKDNGNQEKSVSSYLKYLPAIFQQNTHSENITFIACFLIAFEQILTGFKDQEGLEKKIDRIHTYLDPNPLEPEESKDAVQRAPEKFLPWLASWISLNLRDNWQEDEKRRFIREVVPLYRLRGTKAGLEGMIRIYTGKEVRVKIIEESPNHSYPHYFEVELQVEGDRFGEMEPIVKAIIDQEKPAHTFYSLRRVD